MTSGALFSFAVNFERIWRKWSTSSSTAKCDFISFSDFFDTLCSLVSLSFSRVHYYRSFRRSANKNKFAQALLSPPQRRDVIFVSSFVHVPISLALSVWASARSRSRHPKCAYFDRDPEVLKRSNANRYSWISHKMQTWIASAERQRHTIHGRERWRGETHERIDHK